VTTIITMSYLSSLGKQSDETFTLSFIKRKRFHSLIRCIFDVIAFYYNSDGHAHSLIKNIMLVNKACMQHTMNSKEFSIGHLNKSEIVIAG
jgi:hypothetical protein